MALPPFEEERLAALDSLGLVDSPAEERFDRVTELAKQLFDVPVAFVSFVTATRQWAKSIQGLTVREVPRSDSFCTHTVFADELLVVPDAKEDPRFSAGPLVAGDLGARFYAGCPLHYRDQPIGTLGLIDRKPRELDAEQQRALRNLAEIVETELRLQALSAEQTKLLRELDESRRQALLDSLTGAWNRRGVEEILPRELSRAARSDDPVAIMLVSVNRFDETVSRLGASGSNSVLQELAGRLRHCIRPHDLLGRYENDEFIVFLASCGRDDARMVGGRMITAVDGRPMTSNPEPVECSLSIGLYTMQEVAGRSMGQIVEAAYQALFRARDSGTNQIAHY